MNPVQALPDRLILLQAAKPGLRAHKVLLTEQISQLAGVRLAGLEFYDDGVRVALTEDDPALNDQIHKLIADFQPPALPEIPTLQARLDALDVVFAQKGELYHEDVKQALAGLVGVLRDVVARLDK